MGHQHINSVDVNEKNTEDPKHDVVQIICGQLCTIVHHKIF